MTDFSMATTKLAEITAKLRSTADEYDGKFKADLEFVAIGSGSFPVLDSGAAAAYEKLRLTTDDARRNMITALRDISDALQTVVTYYEQMETQHGQSFSAPLK